MKNKKTIITLIVCVLLVFISSIIYFILNKQDKNTTLTILEKQWIEKNKNNIIDLSIVNNIPVFNYDGKGVFFDFIDSIEKDTGLNFNKLSYEINFDASSQYAFKIVDKLEENQILIYEDNYVLLTKEKVKYNNISEITDLEVGVLSTDLSNIEYYLYDNDYISYKTYNNVNTLLNDFNNNKVNGIILPKNMYLKEIIENEKYNISYDIPEMKKYYVLELGQNKRLNKIINKYYKKWCENNYQESYNTNFSDNYFAFKQIYEQDKVNFRGKRYSYGFINYAPYDQLINKKLVGINNELIKGFAKTADIEISFEQYKDNEELLKAFNENKIDFYFNTSSLDNYDIEVYETVSIYNEEIVVLSKIGSNNIINSLSSLRNKSVITINNSKILQQLNDNKINVKTYDTLNKILDVIKPNDIIVIDKKSYETYMYDKLKDYRIDYMYNLTYPYIFISSNISDNKIFNEYFDFYLSFVNEKKYENSIDYTMFKTKITDNKAIILVLVGIVISIIAIIVLLLNKIKPKTKKDNISKEDKLKYIDMLTSLKNRNYLNESMEKWDNSEIYPQAIVIVDLNNVAYINDNYGHEEGDNIIKEAASILIKTQLENTEIMRTNGNEFLVYMVEYDEKQVVSYIRKLNKEFKELNHGFGAALGYSIITDQLKTIDDAINEATLDMKSNKEEIQN